MEGMGLEGRVEGARLGRGVRLGEHEVPVGDAAVGDPHLVAVEHPRVALLHRRGLRRAHIRARTGLGHAVGGLQRLVAHAAEVLHLLLVRGRDDQRRLGEAVGLHRRHDALWRGQGRGWGGGASR